MGRRWSSTVAIVGTYGNAETVGLLQSPLEHLVPPGAVEFDLRDSKIPPIEQTDIENGRLHNTRLLHRFEVFGNALFGYCPVKPVPPCMNLDALRRTVEISGIQPVRRRGTETTVKDSIARITIRRNILVFILFLSSGHLPSILNNISRCFAASETGIAGLAVPARQSRK